MNPLNFLISSMSQHRVFHALLLAYVTFFYQVFQEASKPREEPALASGLQLLDPNVEPIKRTDASVSAHHAGITRPHRQTVARQHISEEEMLAAANPFNDTEAEVFERALKAAVHIPDEQTRGRTVSQVYRGLANVYSSRGKYLQMLHGMDAAIGAAELGQCRALTGSAHLNLGQLELKHHRYYAAETRFDDAMVYASSMQSQEAVTLRCGHGWAALMQGKHQTAEERFSTTLQLADNVEKPAEGSGSDPIQLTSCKSRGDGADIDRATALLGLVLSQRQQSSANETANEIELREEKERGLVECATSILESELRVAPTEPRAPGVWNALGYAQHLQGRHEEAMQLHKRARDLQNAHNGLRDLPASSHTELYLGLAKFSNGNTEHGTAHVEELLASPAPPAEVAEWLVRFARAHTHGASPTVDQDYGALLFSKATDLLKQIGVRRLVKHLVEYGRFLYGLRPPRLESALEPLLKAKRLIEASDPEYPIHEQAALHNLIAAIEHRRGNIDEALAYFNQALQMDQTVAQRSGGAANYEKLMVSYANVGAMRLQVAGHDVSRWRAVVEDFRSGFRMAKLSGLAKDHQQMVSFMASYNNVMRLAHKQGVFKTCLGQLAQIMYGPTCTTEDDDS